MPVSFSEFAGGVGIESAFSVLAVARQLKAAGKRVIELEIGDSPFPATRSAKLAAIAAIEADQSRYGPSIGIGELCAAAAHYMQVEHRVTVTAENVVIGSGAKIFEQLFCEAFLGPGDGVLVFSPYFPTYLPNIGRRARTWLADLRSCDRFRPRLDEVERFLRTDPRPKAIFLNSPHNPTGGVATAEDLRGLADLVRGRDIAIFSDEPYDQMVLRTPRDAAGRAGNARPMRRGVHIQQVVQHERLSARLRRQQPEDHRAASDAAQHHAVVRAPFDSNGGNGGITSRCGRARPQYAAICRASPHPGRGARLDSRGSLRAARRHVLRLSRRHRDLQSPGPLVAWPGDVFARGGR